MTDRSYLWCGGKLFGTLYKLHCATRREVNRQCDYWTRAAITMRLDPVWAWLWYTQFPWGDRGLRARYRDPVTRRLKKVRGPR